MTQDDEIGAASEVGGTSDATSDASTSDAESKASSGRSAAASEVGGTSDEVGGTTTTRVDALVIGGGISGLAAAFELVQAGLRPVLLEASSRLGGVIETTRRTSAEGAWVFEQGPNTVLGRPAVQELVDALELADRALAARTEAKRRYLWHDGRLVPLPASPPALVRTPLFSWRAKLRLLGEPFVRRAPADREETIAQFVRRRLGDEVLERAVGPFVSGIHAGDPSRLAVRWALPRLSDLEQSHGGLFRGLLASRRAGAHAPMLSFRDGLGELPVRLGDAISKTGAIRLDTPCMGIARDGNDLVIETERDTVRTRRLVMAVPAPELARLLSSVTEGRSDPFARLPYAPVVVGSFGFRRSDVAHPLDGFGFLAPRSGNLRILGCLFPSTLFRDRAPADHVLLTVFAGGRTDPTLLDGSNESIRQQMLDDLDTALGLRGEPVAEQLRRWPRAIPQYELGHGSFVDLARKLERDLPGLAITGNHRGGPSVPDCIEHARTRARALLAP